MKRGRFADGGRALGIAVALVATTLAAPRPAAAQDDRDPELVRAWGPLVLGELGDEGIARLVEICDTDAAGELIACTHDLDEAQEIVVTATRKVAQALADTFGARALEELGVELVVLEADELAELHAACAGSEGDLLLACLREGLAQRKVVTAADVPPEEETASAIDDPIASILEYIDVELPGRLSEGEYEKIAARCETPGAAWVTCATEHGVDADGCFDAEDALARCIVASDAVTEAYLAVRDDKKQTFGKELYVEFGGLMAVLPLDAIRALREACPQADVAAAAACFQSHPAVAELIAVFYEAAAAVVAEAQQELAAHGHEIDVDAYTEQFAYLFLTLPSHAIQTLGTACLTKHPELEDATEPAALDTFLACIAEEAESDPVSNPAYISIEKLAAWLAIARTKVIDGLRRAELDKQDESFERMLLVLAAVAVLGFVIVLGLPLILRRRYPEHSGLLWRASALAAVTFAVTVGLLGATLLVMRTVQAQVAVDSTSPKMVIATAVFDVLEDEETVEGFSELSKLRLDFVKSALRRVVAGAPERSDEYLAFAAYLAEHWASLLDEPELKRLARNVDTLQEHAASFRRVFSFYRGVDWVMGIVPIALSILAVLLYLVPLRETLVDIASAPARAARMGAGVGGDSARARALVWAEVKSALPFMALVLVFLPVVGLFLSLAVRPLIELLLMHALLTMFYIVLADASAWVLYASLGSAILLLVACMAVYVTAMVFYLGRVRRILRAVFHEGARFRDFERFWIAGTAAVVGVLVFPVVFVYGLDTVATHLFDPDLQALSASDMLLIALPAFLSFPILFWAARGFRALAYVKGPKRPKA